MKRKGRKYGFYYHSDVPLSAYISSDDVNNFCILLSSKMSLTKNLSFTFNNYENYFPIFQVNTPTAIDLYFNPSFRSLYPQSTGFRYGRRETIFLPEEDLF